MELLKLDYYSIMIMPVKRLTDIIDWKIKFDKDKEKQRSQGLGDLKL